MNARSVKINSSTLFALLRMAETGLEATEQFESFDEEELWYWREDCARTRRALRVLKGLAHSPSSWSLQARPAPPYLTEEELHI